MNAAARLAVRRNIRRHGSSGWTGAASSPPWGSRRMAGRIQCAETVGQLPQRHVDGGTCASGAPPLRTLTYDPEHPEQFLDLYQASPFGQAAQFELLVRLIEKQGARAGRYLRFRLPAGRFHGAPGVRGRRPLAADAPDGAATRPATGVSAERASRPGPARTASTSCWRAATARRPSPPRRAANAWRWWARAWPRRWTACCSPAAPDG